MSKKPVWREYGEALIIAFILAMIIRFFIVQAYQIPSASMQNTLLIGDRLLLNKLSYSVKMPFTDKVLVQLGEPKIGDIAVFTTPDPINPGVDYVKRIVGGPGDVIEMRNNVLYRNGEEVDEPYVRKGPNLRGGYTNYLNTGLFVRGNAQHFEPITVPADHYFMLGDNRDDSRDSRFWGFVHRNAMHGKAWRLYWSWGDKDDGESGLRTERLGQLVE